MNYNFFNMTLLIERYSSDNILGYGIISNKRDIIRCILNYSTGEATITQILTNDLGRVKQAIKYLKYSHDFNLVSDTECLLYHKWLESRKIFNHNRAQ